jgi:hypothetical protein
MSRIKFNDEYLIGLLEEGIPEFGKSIVPEFRFSAYMIYGSFGTFLLENILHNPLSMSDVEKGFQILNDLILNGDDDIVQMLRVTTFEILTDDDRAIATAKMHLNDKALQIFLEVIKLLK